MADHVGPPEGPGEHEEEAHLPSATIWPFAFAAGLALVLLGLVLASWLVVAVATAIALVFGFLWARAATREYRGTPAEEEVEEEERYGPADEGLDASEEEDVARYPRARFLEGATLGLGALIGGIVTVPSVVFAAGPAFLGQEADEVDLGPLENFPEGSYVIATFLSTAGGAASGVSRRTAFVRNNGMTDRGPSFTILSNSCVHLGCPTQPQGVTGEPRTVETRAGDVVLTETEPSGFGCPCHGGAYDSEGNRTAGPPVRALDRYRYKIVRGRLVLTEPYSVSEVSGEGADATIEAYDLHDPGQHVDGPEKWFYPYVP